MKQKLLKIKKELLLLTLAAGTISGLYGCDNNEVQITYVYKVYEKQIDENNNEKWVLINDELELYKDLTDDFNRYPGEEESSDKLKYELVSEYVDCTKNKKKKVRQK